MSEKTSGGELNRTEALIVAARQNQDHPPLLLSPDYLDDENLPDDERTTVLSEIFSRDVRQAELQSLARHFSPLLNGSPVHHLLICGPTGSGKTATLLHFLASLQNMAVREKVALDWRFVELSAQSTCFAALNRIAVSLDASRSYFKGIPIEMMQTCIRDNLRLRQGVMIFFFDEIDNVVVDRDIFMTYLIKSLPRQTPLRLIYVFTTNRLDWEKGLDARVSSCMRKQDLIFNPYHALEITEILNLRVEKALDPTRVQEAAISLIAAVSSRNFGDARKAVELLAKSVMIAERSGGHLTTEAVEVAEKELEVEKTLNLAQTLPLHQKMALAACYALLLQKQKRVNSGEVYDAYQQIASRLNRQALSQRRFSDILSSLDLYSLIDARLTSHGRYGKTREICNPVGDELAQRTLKLILRQLGCE